MDATTSTDFGRILTAMVTPFRNDSTLDVDAAQGLARYLTRTGWNDGLVVNGTTGESITTSDVEKRAVIEAVVDAVDPSVKVVAGVGTADTRHSVELAHQAEAAGAAGLLVVTPYYSRPSQRGLVDHFRAIADATSLPVMLYDIPKRAGVGIDAGTVALLSEHPRITALKDARGDLEFSSWVLRETDLRVYSGDDALNLPFLAIGASGFVSVVGHFVADRLRQMQEAYARGDVVAAQEIHVGLLPVFRAVFRHPGVATTKAGLGALGMPVGPTRAPMAGLTIGETAALMADLRDAGVESALRVLVGSSGTTR
ncbi:4-hydroxy-tetrahydrodipicolinate synthase [Xylanimonas allomyrinae]|uniref:4-hydroxy-tetrahydrodipicolinate synthase n=1 Tax=Xylanimonas allomyrinae TaxID=2509459 RepID=A0A4P6EI91_9MICO|nr:4-hydroxy-tetrahydrodipicolinate synthase [Xylanimonas allomyrinae]QAY62144.1 4-hydroxy-tetrahydrodipicolinate synthase [Xylanimonas allomyrinae]